MPQLPRPDATRVATLMGEATRDVLWELYSDRIHATKARARLRTRVADGRATNHRLDGPDVHVISFGWKMVRDKLSGAARAATWLSGREIERRRYFGGELTALNLLAHTVCHEFAHLLQTVDGERRYRSVHNRAFYRLLRQLHDEGAAELVRDHLGAAAAKGGIPIDWSDEEARRSPPVAVNAASTRPARGVGFQRGELVAFDVRGEEVVGRVRRVNRRTITVVPTEVSGRVRWWRVSPGLLRKVG